jgi:hypothetical protein
VDACPICGRPKDTQDFCNVHSAAATNLERQFENWSIAFDESLSKDHYLDNVRNLHETGEAVKKVIDNLRDKRSVTP